MISGQVSRGRDTMEGVLGTVTLSMKRGEGCEVGKRNNIVYFV